MCRIDGIRTVNPSRRDHTDGRLLVLHDVHLYRGGLGTEQNVVSNIEGILCIPCRMVGRQVQCLKVIVIVFDLRTVCHRKAHAQKDLPNFVFHDGQRMHAAHLLRLARQRDVHGFCRQLMRQRSLRQTLLFVCQQLFDVRAHLIGELPHCRTLLRRELSHLLQDRRQLSFFSQILHTQIFQQFRIRTVSQRLLGSTADCFQLFFHTQFFPFRSRRHTAQLLFFPHGDVRASALTALGTKKGLP